MINRFSEDIDLILDWRVLGYEKDEPWEKRSNTKQDAFNKEANARAEVFLKETFCPVIRDELSQELEQETDIYIDEVDRQTVIFSYPRLFTGMGTLQVIRLEIGALAAWTPAKSAEIVPYAAEYYPDVFKQRGTDVLTVAPERTFWEKATILHHESNRPEHLEMPQRYSRHYYDLYRMAATSVKEVAFSRLDLLKKVVDFKMKFYPRAWAKYSEAVSGSLKLEMIDLFVTPLCTVLATAFLTLGIIGPIFSLTETYVLDFTRWLITVGFGVGSMLMGALYPLTVV